MLSNLPVAEALSARTPTPAAQTTDAKAGTPGQNFFDVFANEPDPQLTSAPAPQSEAQDEPSVDSTPKGAETPEVAGLPSDTIKSGAALGSPGILGSLTTKPHAPQTSGTPENAANQADIPSKSMGLPTAATSRQTGRSDTEALSDPRSDLGRRPEGDPRSGAIKPLDAARPLGTPKKPSGGPVNQVALESTVRLSEQVIRTHMAEKQPRTQVALAQVAGDQRNANHVAADRGGVMHTGESQTPDARQQPGLATTLGHHMQPVDSAPPRLGVALDQSPHIPGGSHPLNDRIPLAPKTVVSDLSPQPRQSGVSDTRIDTQTSGTQMSPTAEKIALSAQEQVFLNTNRPSSDGQQIVHPTNATSQPILRQMSDQPVAPQISALASKTPMMQEQATASMRQAGATWQAPTEAGAVIKGAPVSGAAHAIGMPVRPTQVVMQPTAPSHSVPSDADMSVVQEALGKQTAKTSDTPFAPQSIAVEPKARPTHAPLSEAGKQVRPGGSQPASSHTLISPQGGANADQNMPVPQVRMTPTESETKVVSTLSQNQPKGSVTETVKPTPVAVSKADRATDSDAPFTTRQSEVPVQQGAVNPSASGLKTAMSNTNMHISPAISQGMSTSALLHDAELAVDDPSGDPARLSEQVSFGTSVSEAPIASAARPEMIRSIAAQMAAAAPRGMQAPVEIALNPEELGQVKMSVTTTDTAVVMTIAAERPETLELMRRNLEQLTNEFRDLGYSDINFVFTGDGSESANNSEGSHDNQTGSSAEQEQVALTEKQTPSATSSGVDVRV